MTTNEDITFDELDQTTKDLLFENINKTLTDNLFTPIKQLYVDWSYIQDIYIGALVNLCKSQQDYNYILKQIPNYNDRIVRGCSSYFPELNYTDNDLIKFMNTKDNGLLVLGTSPMTNIFRNLKTLVEQAQLRNLKLGYTNKLKLIFNLYPININRDIAGLISYMINQVLFDMDFDIISKPINTIEIETLVNCDILLIDRMDIFFTKDSNTTIAFFDDTNFPFSKCAIVTPKVIDNTQIQEDLSNKSQEEIDSIFKITAHLCGIMSNFIYINPIIFIDNTN